MDLMTDYFNSVHNFKWFHEGFESQDVCICCGKDKTLHYPGNCKVTGVVRCKNCGFLFRAEQPTDAALERFYKESEAMKKWSVLKEPKEEEARQLIKYSRIYKAIQETGVKSILDVGCGDGFFLNRIFGDVDKIGIDPSDEYAKRCLFPRYKSYEHLMSSTEAGRRYDLVTMFGCLEHLKSPRLELNRYLSLLKEGGLFCCIVPNADSLVVQTLKTDCSTFCPQHLWYFSIETLREFMASLGMKLAFFYTIEPETQPILRKLRGFAPYEKIGITLTDKDITDDNILEANKGYKLCALFAKEKK